MEPGYKHEEELEKEEKNDQNSPVLPPKNSPKKSPAKNQTNASSRHKSSNVVLTDLVSKTMKDLKELDNLGVEVETPEKIAKTKKLAAEVNQRPDLKRSERSTRSRSQPRPKEPIEAADVQTS